MIQKTSNANILLNYLKKEVYNHIPKPMWDRDLWLYNMLTKLLDIPITVPSERVNNVEFFYIGKEPLIEGLICKEDNEREITYYIYSNNTSLISQYLAEEQEKESKKIVVSTINQTLAVFLVDSLNHKIEDGLVKFYKNSSKPELIENCTKILQKHLVEYKEISYLEPCIKFINYFAYVHEDRVTSTCGVAPINNRRAEIIGVNTYDKLDRNKGYAKSVCTYAMNAMSNDFEVFTWRTQHNNLPSISIANSLGFIEYQKDYFIRVV